MLIKVKKLSSSCPGHSPNLSSLSRSKISNISSAANILCPLNIPSASFLELGYTNDIIITFPKGYDCKVHHNCMMNIMHLNISLVTTPPGNWTLHTSHIESGLWLVIKAETGLWLADTWTAHARSWLSPPANPAPPPPARAAGSAGLGEQDVTCRITVSKMFSSNIFQRFTYTVKFLRKNLIKNPLE